jgi:hypothetical protein
LVNNNTHSKGVAAHNTVLRIDSVSPSPPRILKTSSAVKTSLVFSRNHTQIYGNQLSVKNITKPKNMLDFSELKVHASKALLPSPKTAKIKDSAVKSQQQSFTNTRNLVKHGQISKTTKHHVVTVDFKKTLSGTKQSSPV